MSKSLEQKIEDQQKFDNLPKKEQSDISEEAHGEAMEMNKEQREKLQPMSIVYRDNDLFQEMIPQMVSILQSMGREVNIKNFPREMDRDEIEQWIDQNRSILSGAELLCDYTVGEAVEYNDELLDELNSSGFKMSEKNLDMLINSAAERVVLGEAGKDLPDVTGDEKLKSLDDFKRYFSTFTEYILRNPENKPQRVIIFEDNLKDHIDELFNLKRINQDDVNQVLETLKSAFIEGGIEAEKITIMKKDEKNYPGQLKSVPEEVRAEIDQPSNWLIIDRHGMGRIREIKSAKRFQLPEGNFFEDVRSAGLINIKQEEILKYLEQMLKDNFGRKKED